MENKRRNSAIPSDVSARARDLSGVGAGPPSTGFLLLAILTGSGTAARTLSLRGLTETKVRSAIRREDPDPKEAVGEVEMRTARFTETFGSRHASALHLLAALTAVRSCQAYRILTSEGLDTDVIRNQALRCLTTSLTREHGPSPDRAAGVPPERDVAVKAAPAPVETPFSSRRRADDADPPSLDHQTPRGGKGRGSGRGLRRKGSRIPTNSRLAGESIERIQRRARMERSAARRAERPQTSAEEPPAVELEDAVDLDEAAAEIGQIAERDPLPSEQTAAGTETVGFDIDAKQFPVLSGLGRNLTLEAAAGRLDPIVGREREMEQIADVLNKRRANSPCLVGPPGVGKTAIAEGLAARLAAHEAPGLEDRAVVEIRPGDLLSGTSLRGALSERFGELREEIARLDGQVVLFFDEIHVLLGSADAAEAVAELKDALGRGELPCIAATTREEYSRHVESDPALARRFTLVEIDEPSEDEAVAVLEGLAPAYEEHHGTRITSEAMSAAVRLSARYVQDRALPDKAVALLDLAGARARRSNREEISRLDVAQVLSEQIGVPPERLVAGDRERLLDLERELEARIVGHRHVLDAIGETLRRNAAGFRSGRPIGSFLFLGPTGVGKTETAKALADLLFPGGDATVRLDMTEFAESHAVARLVGAPPGYIGHEEGGQLTEAVRRRPYCLVLFDEIEKAHRDVIQVLLQVLDDGRLTDGRGRTVPLENAVIAMTSNLGSDLRELTPRRRVGFGALEPEMEVPSHEDVRGAILEKARAALPPELWNRIDEPLVFSPLDSEEVSEIATRIIAGLSSQLQREHGVSIAADGEAIGVLLRAGGYDPQLGARPMRRTIQRLIEGPVARLILEGGTVSGDVVRIGAASEDELDFVIEKSAGPGLLDAKAQTRE
ncbi:MAG: ATP-dependent Clp protease ATP-binding subunit [Polyangia bacterium]